MTFFTLFLASSSNYLWLSIELQNWNDTQYYIPWHHYDTQFYKKENINDKTVIGWESIKWSIFKFYLSSKTSGKLHFLVHLLFKLQCTSEFIKSFRPGHNVLHNVPHNDCHMPWLLGAKGTKLKKIDLADS